MIGAIIGAGLSFLGARKNRKAQEGMHAQDTYNNSPQGIRANAEAAGFNPLTVLGSGRSFGAGYTPIFDNDLAHLGTMVEDGLGAMRQQKTKMTQLKGQNQRLQNLVERTTLGTKSPGVYERRQADALANHEVGSDHVRGGLDNSAGLGGSSWVAPGRKTEVAPYTSGSGLTEINNRGTFGPIVVPGADGEPWGIDEVATAVIAGVPQVVYRAGAKVGNYLDQKRNNSSWDEWVRRSKARTRVPYSPKLNPPLRGYYGPPGSRTGF